MRRITTLSFAAAALLATAAVAYATPLPYSYKATDNATVQGAGPRTGANGKAFFNMEGSSNGTFASFGVADFDLSQLSPALGETATDVGNISLSLTQSNAAFSVAGAISVFYTAKNTVDIQPGTSPLKDTGAGDGAASVDSALSPLTLLGTGAFTNVANGTVDTVPLTFTTGSDAYNDFLTDLNNGKTLRLIVTVNDPGTAATYAGFSNSTFAGPTLNFDVNPVPEPSTLILAGLSVLGCVAWKKRRS
jgi:hypothetical protein